MGKLISVIPVNNAKAHTLFIVKYNRKQLGQHVQFCAWFCCETESSFRMFQNETGMSVCERYRNVT